jgi:two-component system CheB/CheR fusion protein
VAIDASQIESGFHIVGVGASAGGLESLERFFTRLPADTGMAFVVLQHLSPDFKSLMDELLGRRTSMTVRQAEHEALIEPNVLYLLPPMKEMIVQKRRLLLSDRDPRHGLALPIDHFFRSLAQDVGDRSIAIVLSGTGSDGSRGIQDVRRAGGLVFCESPETAQFNGMPLSAIATGTVDQVLAPEEIADAVATLSRPASSRPEDAAAGRQANTGIDALLLLLQQEYAIDFSQYKSATVTRRIERRLTLNKSMDIEAYLEHLRSDPRELNALYEDLLIGVTRFFRDDGAFDALQERIIPAIVDGAIAAGGDAPVRVWVPGCATGQEAYSVAILLHEALLARRRPLNVKILATDVHKTSLEVAGSGLYSEEQVAGISPDRLERFFTRKSNGYQVCQSLRESVVFAPHNLMRDSPFTKLDLITCRNLLIYFHPHAQKTVLTLFHFGLKTGGYLFLGPSESPGDLADEFDTVDPHVKIYRKRRDIGLPADLRLPLPRSGSAPAVSAVGRGSAVSAQLLSTYDRLLERYMPPSFLIDERGRLVDSYGGVASLLRMKGRRPSAQLLDLLDDEMRTVVSAALHRVAREADTVAYDDMRVPGIPGPCSLVAEPISDARGSHSHVLLSFIRSGAPRLAPVAEGAAEPAPVAIAGGAVPGREREVEAVSGENLRALRDELSYTKENLQAAVENLEATNEELQATNEELIASNEELQSTNEELHSVNEELYTVNAEYQKKNAELLQLNGDIEHLLNETDVATIFLDRDLCIRKFTRRMAEIFHLLPQDVGRPLRSFSHSLSRDGLMRDIARALDEDTTIEAQTWDAQHRCYFLRILPYRSRAAEDSTPPDGVVVTLTDISPLEQARARVAQLSAIVESSEDAIIGTALTGSVTSWNDGARRLFGYSAEEVTGRHLMRLLPHGQQDAFDGVVTDAGRDRPRGMRETTGVRKDGAPINVSVTFSPVFDGGKVVVGVSAIVRDITALVAARDEIASREEQIRLLLDSTAEAIYGVGLNGECTFCNTSCARLLGYHSPDQVVGRNMHALTHHTRPDGSAYPPEQSAIHESMRNRGPAHVSDEVLWRADGTSFPAEYWSHPIVSGADVIGAVVTFLDITERRQAEEEIQEGVRRREHFLAMLSHELRNPLAAILGATRLLDLEGWGNDRCQEAGRVVERQAKHMTRLLDDLLDVSRITHGRIVLRPETVDLRDTARAAIEALAPLMAEQDTPLVVEMPEAMVPVFGDPARLQQIQANLLSNASRYSDRGREVRFTLGVEGEDAVVTVTDRGRGIEPSLLPRIFDLFVQGPQTIARSDGGLGIGLTLLRSLVELHDGRVAAFSGGQGSGSTFVVRLPLARRDAGSTGAGTAAPAAPVRTVVLVEDQADARRMMQLLLEADGREVFIADNGLAGAELIERVRPDLAIVDLGLPVMSGFDVARRLRANAATRDTRLIAWSGYGQDADVQAALAAGFDDHITKPPDPDRLEQILAGTGPGRVR